MLTIRLQRRGKKNQPFFKIIVTEEKNSSTRGRSVEELGFYNPLTKERSLNADRAKPFVLFEDKVFSSSEEAQKEAEKIKKDRGETAPRRCT